MSSRYPESLNIFPNRPHWDENGVFTPVRNKPPICSCPPEISPPPNLCAQCQKIRLRHLIFCEAEGRMVDLGRLDAMVKRTECDFCSLVALGCKQTWQGTGTWENALESTDTTCFINALEVSRQQSRGYALQVTERHTRKPFQGVEFEIIFNRDGPAPKPVERSFEVCPKVDLGPLKSMFRDCEDNHRNHRDLIPARPIDDMYFINVKEMRIVIAPAGATRRYCALSYVWGKPSKKWLTLTRENSASLSGKVSLRNANVPQTIRDAMQVCLEIGENYLWVDSLCIVQDDSINQKRQMDIMDFIYSQAAVTIVAAAGDHADSGLPGVSTWLRDSKRQTITIQDMEVSNVLPRLKDTVNRSAWNTRGWTYQERIFSKRCIFFTESQAYYACSEGVQYEREDRLLPDTAITERFQNAWLGRLGSSSSSSSVLALFSQSVTDYTLRTLTSQADILRAFQGIMSNIMRTHVQNFHFGLPDGCFEDALLWQPVGRSERRVTHINLPSWSWASVNGPIKYTFKEERIISLISATLPAYWQDGEEPPLFPINWLLNLDGTHVIAINNNMPATTDNPSEEQPPHRLYQLALQKPGRLLFSTQCSYMKLRNGVPYTTQHSWWTDYTQDIDLSTISIVSILLPGNQSNNLAGFVELDKVWAEQNLQPENEQRKWKFIAISLATSKSDDYMHMYLTQLRNTNFSLVWSRNVRQLLVNVILIDWDGDVARRLGVGKVFLDMWEKADLKMKCIVLE